MQPVTNNFGFDEYVLIVYSHTQSQDNYCGPNQSTE